MKLKRCPFCGGEARNITHSIASCSNRLCILYAMAIKHKEWNTRTPSPSAQKVIEAAIAVREQLAGGVINSTVADVLFTILDEPVTEYQKETP